jgi:hypothetical protein
MKTNHNPSKEPWELSSAWEDLKRMVRDQAG